MFEKILTLLRSNPETRKQKSRLEAYITAFPGDYCGFGSDGEVTYSAGFCQLLGVEAVRSLLDIQTVLPPSDSAALEGYFDRLEDKATPFTLICPNLKGDQHFKFTGAQGRDLNDALIVNILWVEDITDEAKAMETYNEQKREREREMRKYQEALDNVPFPCWLRDEAQKILWANKAYAAALNEKRSVIIDEQKELCPVKRPVKRAVKRPVKGDKAQQEPALMGADLAKHALDSGVEQTSETHIVVNGKRILMRMREIAVPLAHMTLGMAQDISKLDAMTEKLTRYQASNREMLEQLRSAIGIYDSEQRLEFYNSSFSQLWGLEEGWLNTRPRLGDIMDKLRETRRLPEQADFKGFKKSWLDMFTSLINAHEDMLYLPDDTALRMLVVPQSLGGLMMTFENVTSRLELESSYNTLIAVQKETLDNLGEGVAVYGGDGRLKLSNPAYGALWGFNPEDLDGEPHISKLVDKKHEYFDKTDWPKKRETLISHGLDRVAREGRLHLRKENLIDYSTVPLPDGGVLITYIDVTDSVRVENALREKNAALEAAEQLKLDFLANVSYQLRTPLNAIMGFNEILDQEFFGKLNKRQKQYTHDIHEASGSLLHLINDILDLSSLEAGYMNLNKADIKIYDMAQSVGNLVKDWARKKQIDIQITCAKNIGEISADEKRLKQAIINIIRNSINFTPEHGKIEMRMKRSQEQLEIKVTDNGVGIPKEDRSRIFQPFERAQGSFNENRISRGGAGLGLSLVKNIINLHGGDVTIENAPEKGTIVTMTLPVMGQETPLKLPLGASDTNAKAS